ncbi:hypothetical protein QBC45DRAFT_399049 [Copromyces sp. CBS 386.78]|nr:hypothetical protein QBC45DRAFT_399049 [Copromyces sp. CBS 386.78]
MPDRYTYPPFWDLRGHETPMLHPRGTPRGGSYLKPPSPQFSFPVFPRLPREVRLRIWEMTVEPRIVEVRVKYSKQDADYDQVTNRFNKVSPEEGKVFPLFSSTPVPAPLQACREARNHLGTVCYEKAFWDLPVVRPGQAGEEMDEKEELGEKELDQAELDDENELPLDEKNREQQRTDSDPTPDLPEEEQPPKYVWMNFPQDMLSLGPSLFHHFVSSSSTYTSKITALRFQRDLLSSEAEAAGVDLPDLRLISKFINIKDLHIICAYGQDVDDWAGVETELEMKFPIPRWEVLVVAPGDDLVVDAYEIDVYEKAEWENNPAGLALRALRGR